MSSKLIDAEARRILEKSIIKRISKSIENDNLLKKEKIPGTSLKDPKKNHTTNGRQSRKTSRQRQSRKSRTTSRRSDKVKDYKIVKDRKKH